jgi:dCTP deaminase
MVILSDKDIIDHMKSGGLSIEGFDERNLTPNGYDVSIEEIFYDDRTFKSGTVEIQPQAWFAVSTKEYFRIGDQIAAQLWLRTTWIRKGITSSFGMVDSGFEGTLTFSGFNASNNKVELGIGDRFAQIVFERLSSEPAKSYGERSGRFLKQKGITLESPGQKRNEP